MLILLQWLNMQPWQTTATGFEALMGYLYLKDDFSRIIELVRAGIGEDKI